MSTTSQTKSVSPAKAGRPGKPLIANEVVHALIQHFDEHDLSNKSVSTAKAGRPAQEPDPSLPVYLSVNRRKKALRTKKRPLGSKTMKSVYPHALSSALNGDTTKNRSKVSAIRYGPRFGSEPP